MHQSTCSIEGCEKTILGRGWCSMHYSRWRRNGDPGDPGRTAQPCVIDGCDEPRLSRGLCNMHRLRRDRESANAFIPNRLRTRASACSIPGCGRRPTSNGLCDMHYQRLRKRGETGGVTPERLPGRVCSEEGCMERHHGRGLCLFHLAHAGAERYRDCGRCGAEIDMMQIGASGRKQHGSTRLCKPCRAARSTRAKWSPAALAAIAGSDACGICGQAVDLSLRLPDRRCGSVDHILPVARGGSNDLNNMQLAHLDCNMRKGARVDLGSVMTIR